MNNRYILSTITLLIFLLSHTAFAFDARGFKCKQKQHSYGMIGSAVLLDEIEKTLNEAPPLSHTGKSLVTLNKQGFDVVEPLLMQDSFLIQDLAAFAKKAKKPILEIGGGYGRLTKVMLDQGATVIENDLELQHLIHGRKLIPQEQRNRIYYNTYRFPRNMIIKANSVSGVVVHRVFHLMSSDEIEEGLAKINRWLVPGGKVFIAVLPPQHSKYRDKVLSHYEKRWQDGYAWPGEGLKSAELLPEQVYALPKTLHVMDERPLTKALEKYGFKVERTGFIPLKKIHHSSDDAKELFGIIAIKKS